MKADKQATETRKFVESKSHVTKDGREVLYKLDWQRRVKELRERCGGQCENVLGVKVDYSNGYGVITDQEVRCTREAADPHHIHLRSRGRDDRMSNLLAVCRSCHFLLDKAQRKERHKR